VTNGIKTYGPKALEKAVKKFVTFHGEHGGRMDTVFRSVISKLFNSKAHRTPYLLNFVLEKSSDYYSVGILDERQMFRFCSLSPDTSGSFAALSNLVSRFPYTSSKATLLESVRKRSKDYVKHGISKKRLAKLGGDVVAASGDSEIVTAICAPAFDKALQ
jgi:hypothetical protein